MPQFSNLHPNTEALCPRCASRLAWHVKDLCVKDFYNKIRADERGVHCDTCSFHVQVIPNPDKTYTIRAF